MKEDKVVMVDSPEAATYRTDICGWVSSDGFYLGDKKDSEYFARYRGCTHVYCKDCNTPIQKQYILCKVCLEKIEDEKFAKLLPRVYKGELPLYSEALDKYYWEDFEDIIEDLQYNGGVGDITEAKLVYCEPNKPCWLEVDGIINDYGYDELDPSVYETLHEAVYAFNESVKDVITSYSPTNVRVVFEDE